MFTHRYTLFPACFKKLCYSNNFGFSMINKKSVMNIRIHENLREIFSEHLISLRVDIPISLRSLEGITNISRRQGIK